MKSNVPAKGVDAYGNPINMAVPVMSTDLASFGSISPMKPNVRESTGWRDWPFAIFFLINVAAIVTLLALYGASLFHSTKRFSSAMSNANVMTILAVSGVLSIISTILAFGMLGLTVRFARQMIQVGLWFGVVMCFGIVGLAAYKKLYALSIIAGIMGLIALCYVYAVQERIPFAAANLRVAASAVRSHSMSYVIAFIFLVIQLVWVFIWCVAVIGVTNKLTKSTSVKSSTGTLSVGDRCSKNEDCITNLCVSRHNSFGTSRRYCRNQTAFTQLKGESYVAYFFLLISFFWGVNVCKNIVHATVAGTVATWWYSNVAIGAVRGSLKRSCTTSFGSICLGSLIVAVLQALRQLAEEARRQGDCTACIAECILGCLQDIMETFNRWAFVYVGIYGFKFVDAGRAVMALFHERGFDAIITDDLVSTALGFCACGVGFFCALLGLAYYYIDPAHAQFPNAVFILPFAGLLVGIGIAIVPLGVIDSAVATVYVCFAEDPAALQRNHPALFDTLMTEWHRMYPEVMVATGYFVVA